MATALLTRYGYPKQPGDQPWSIVDVSGPASYTAIVPGSPGPPVVLPTGGQRLTAADFGLQSIDIILGMASTDGLYTVNIIPLLINPLPSPPMPTQLPDGTFEAFLLMWITANDGAEASGNLSASTVRLLASGH